MDSNQPIQPHWHRPSFPDRQEVREGESFGTKSYSKVELPPFSVFANMSFPPCTKETVRTYATVQIARDEHLNLNSDLLYINHSCEPSLIFDTANLNVLVGPRGIKPGDELTFFYPSTEYEMAQPFDCLCGKPTCRRLINGAKNMSQEMLHGVWLNGHIHALLAEHTGDSTSLSAAENTAVITTKGKAKTPGPPAEVDATARTTARTSNDVDSTTPTSAMTAAVRAAAAARPGDPTAQALAETIRQSARMFESACLALTAYLDSPAQRAAISCASSATSSPNRQRGRSSGSRRVLGSVDKLVAAANGSSNHGNNGNDCAVNGHASDAGALVGFPARLPVAVVEGATRRGPTSRERSGEMGGDTKSAV